MRRFLPLLLLLATSCTPALGSAFAGAVYPGAPAVSSDRPAVHRWVLRDRDGIALDIDVVPELPSQTNIWSRDKRIPRAWEHFIVDAQWSDDRRIIYNTKDGTIGPRNPNILAYGDPACESTPLTQIDPSRTEGAQNGVALMQSGEPWVGPVYRPSRGSCEAGDAPEGAPLTPLVPVPPELAGRFNNPPYTVTWE